MEEEASPAWWERTDYLVTTVVKKTMGGGGAGEMSRSLRALNALLKVLSSNPSNHMVAHNHL
jgi:hypothetical protein